MHAEFIQIAVHALHAMAVVHARHALHEYYIAAGKSVLSVEVDSIHTDMHSSISFEMIRLKSFRCTRHSFAEASEGPLSRAIDARRCVVAPRFSRAEVAMDTQKPRRYRDPKPAESAV